tara:strand:- start:367 stop:684 length:318 start_codon:yes stop_codon:yes gene_type:complete
MTDAYTNYEEGIDYTIVPVEGSEAGWDVRILTGEYVETTMRFGNIRIDGEGEEPDMSFNFKVTYSPIEDLTSEDEDLQRYAGDVLLSVISRAIKENALVIDDVKK